MKCKVCNGTGFVGIGPGIRGIKKCDVCNGEGEVNAPERIPNDACPTCRTLFPTDDRADYIPVEEIHFCYHCGARVRGLHSP